MEELDRDDPAEAPPEGSADVVDVVGCAWEDVDVAVAAGVLVDEVVVDVDDGVLLVVAGGDVWAAPEDEVLADEPPQPATTRMSVSAALARMSFEVKACLLPGQAKMAGALGA